MDISDKIDNLVCEFYRLKAEEIEVVKGRQKVYDELMFYKLVVYSSEISNKNMIDAFIWQINNRELAGIIWIIIFFIRVLFIQNWIKSIIGVLKAFFNLKILLPVILFISYILVWIIIFYNFNLWGYFLLKDTILFLLWAVVLLFDSYNKGKSNHGFLKGIFLDLFKLTIFIEFVSNIYTYSFYAELIILPFIVFIWIMANYKSSPLNVQNIFKNILWIIGIFYLIHALIWVIQNWQNLFNINNLYSFLLPIILTILSLPFLYLFVLYVKYEDLFIRFNNTFNQNFVLKNKLKIKVFLLCNISLKKLNKISQSNLWFHNKIDDEEDFNFIINEFKVILK